MYATKNVRPRSSLSTDENHRIKDPQRKYCKRGSNTLLTLIAFCIFLLVLCVFLLGALVYVGKNIAEAKLNDSTTGKQTNLSTRISNEFEWSREHLLSTKPIISSRSDSVTTQIMPTVKSLTRVSVAPAIKAASKVLQKLQYRLPRELKPLKYLLHLQPNLQEKSFTGNVTILLQVTEPISFIPVHAKKLNVSTEQVQRLDESGAPLKVINHSLSFMYPEYEYWVTEFPEPLERGNYTLNLKFNGSLVDRIVGFYQSSYFDKLKNETRWIATSKFEPTYARSAFPCFDEPHLKARFIITVVRPTEDGYHALSNMNVEKEEAIGNLTEVTFAESVPMSTYLVCFIVSDFAHKEKTVSGVLTGVQDFKLRVFATPAQVEKVQYALDTAANITEYYIEFFNVSYPLPKLDMAAIPDFVSGAMENWGLVTFRETALLYDETVSSSSNKQRVATVIAHELAHMWFGNLVTMNWWNDLWLNEGFASYIEYKGCNHVHPEWDMLSQFLISTLHGVLVVDSTLASHPIIKTVENPDQITEIFDAITYSKGASLVRMLEDLVSEELFRNATTRYLLYHYYNSATTDDFLTAIEEEHFDFDVKLIMQTFTAQMGLPVVEVVKDGTNFKLTQKRFLANPDDYNAEHKESPFNYRWSIPISYFTSENSTVNRLIFDYTDNEVTVALPDEVEWIKFNKDQIGYYRVNYPSEQWEALAAALLLQRSSFSNSDRAHLLNDAFALADAGQLNYSHALDLSIYLEHELDYVPWSVGCNILIKLRNLLYYTPVYGNFTSFARKLLTPVVESVTFDVGSDHLQNLLRIAVLRTACSLGHQASLQEVAKRFNEWLENPETRPNPNIREVVYFYGLQQVGTEAAWDQVWDLYLKETDAQEKVKLMKALTAIKVPWILQRYINLAWDEKNVRGQDYFECLASISRNPVGQSLVWEYVRENWLRLVDRFGLNERYLGSLIPSITSNFVTQTKLEEMEAFFAKYPEAGAGTAARKQALATVKINIKWLKHNQAQISDWLTESTTKVPNTELTME